MVRSLLVALPFLERERVKWERDYIWVKMDHRWIGAREKMKELRDGADGGVPWWAILNEDGKVLVTSNEGEGNNIGYPRSKSERAHFRTMLEQTAIRLKADDITSLVDALNSSDH